MPPLPEGVLERATESVMRNERLDGNVPQGFAPTRSKLESIRLGPYNQHMWTFSSSEEQESEEEDHWIFHEESRSLVRWHGTERKGKFIPQDKRGCPIPVKHLQSTACVFQEFPDGKRTMQEVNWRAQRERQGPSRFWVGFTAFQTQAKGLHKVCQGSIPSQQGE